MFGLLGVFSILYTAAQGIKESFTPSIPAENWANKELEHKDIMNGVPMKQIIKNAQNGRYKYSMKYAEPHRDPKTNKKIIENCDLYNEDLKNHGAVQTYKWIDQGKYNLNEKELKICHLKYEKKYIKLYSLNRKLTLEEQKRLKDIDKELSLANWDYRNAEAVLYWQKAHNANR